VCRCDLMYRLIKLDTRGCVGSQIRLAACVSIGKYVAQLALFLLPFPGSRSILCVAIELILLRLYSMFY